MMAMTIRQRGILSLVHAARPRPRSPRFTRFIERLIVLSVGVSVAAVAAVVMDWMVRG